MIDAIFSSLVDFHTGTGVPKTEGIGNCEFAPLGIIPRELLGLIKHMVRDKHLSEVTGKGPSPEKSAYR